MNNKFEAHDSTDEAQEDPSLIASIKKIQRHLVFLEKKIDTLIEQSKGRSFSNKSSHFSKSYKPQTHSHRPDHNNQGRRFDKSSRGPSWGNSPNKKPGFRGGQSNHGRSAAIARR